MPARLTALLLLVAASLCAQAADAGAMELVQKLEAKCRAATSYAYEGELTVEGQRGDFRPRVLAKAKIRLAVAEPGSYVLRIDPDGKDEYLLASDGERYWAYVPKRKEYTEEEGLVLLDEAGGAEPDQEQGLAESFARRIATVFRLLHATAETAEFQGERSVRIDGVRKRHPVVQVLSRKDEGGGHNQLELAIDPATLKVGRLLWDSYSYSRGRKYLVRTTVDFDRFQSGEAIPESMFKFRPPAGAKRVDAVPIPGQSESPLMNRPAPELGLSTLDGEDVQLSELRGRPVLLDFWASWCMPCRRELPSIIKIQEDYKSRGLVVLGVNDEQAEVARKFSGEAGLNFPTMVDSARRAYRLFGVQAIPTVVLIDPQGKVVRYFRGVREESTLRAALRAAGLK